MDLPIQRTGCNGEMNNRRQVTQNMSCRLGSGMRYDRRSSGCENGCLIRLKGKTMVEQRVEIKVKRMQNANENYPTGSKGIAE